VSDLLAARSLFGLSLAFHIVFAAVGVAMPLFMVLAEGRALRTGSEVHRELARRWAKGTAILFAVGAVSGTVISFELGLLWPRFMAFAGPIIGMPFSLEGFAFFAEAIFLGIYLYGWGRVSPRLHLAAGWVVAASGAASAFFVTLANAWMNVPAGFTLDAAGAAQDVRPFVAMFPPGWWQQVLHVLLSCYVATAFAVAGIHAWYLLRLGGTSGPQRDHHVGFHRAALRIVMGVGAVAALLQPLSGDLSARKTAVTQPAKLAAMEAQFETQRGAPLKIGGLPDMDARETRWALEIPNGLSLLAFHDPDAEVKGLEAFPREDWPNATLTHLAFQGMVGLGSLLALAALAWAYVRVRRREPGRRLLWALVALGPAGFLALEAGWLVTEWGRQPFAIQGVMRVADAVTPVKNLTAPFVAFGVLYLFLAVMVVVLLRRQIAHGPHDHPAAAPGPEVSP